MAVLDKMKDTISVAGQEVSVKAKNATESARLNNQIKNNERMIQKLTYQVGVQVVDKDLGNPDTEYEELFSEIRRLQSENQAAKDKLSQVNEVKVCPQCGTTNRQTAKFCINCGAPLTAQEAAAPAGGKKCPACGFVNEDDAAFCVSCGAKLPDVVEEPVREEEPLPTEEDLYAAAGMTEEAPQEEAEPVEEPKGYVCKNCGAVLEDDMLFCINCGTKREDS